MDSNNQSTHTNEPLIVIGIGSSAGGIEALEKLLPEIMPEDNVSVVIVQHLSSDYKSNLTGILQRRTKLHVKEIEAGVKLQPKTIYVAPAGKYVGLENDSFTLDSFSDTETIHLSIDYFFASLASAKCHLSVGIMLSGTGSDGSMGLKEIKQQGGLVIAQDPTSAKFDGMPRSAINTGMVDVVIYPDDIVKYINDINRYLDPENHAFDRNSAYKHLQVIFRQLMTHGKNDFSKYKKSTLYRRIHRRMIETNKNTIEEYQAFLMENAQEVEILFKDFLIGVTSFFRDKKTFENLRKIVLPEIVDKNKTKPIRIWVTACATGEEAYSIAMLTVEYLKEKHITRGIQIFASDIDKQALTIARRGRYSHYHVSDVPPVMLEKYFTKMDGSYQINKEIRDLIVFAEHNILEDPPFSRVEMISCRNFLIYIESEMQKSIFYSFHYALNNDGFLFLGNSETLGISNNLFKIVDNKAKIFRKVVNHNALTQYLLKTKDYDELRSTIKKKLHLPKKKEISVKDFAEQYALKNFIPPFLLINKTGEIIYTLGNFEEYFTWRTGEPTHNIVSLAREGLKVPLSNALRKNQEKPQVIEYKNLKVLQAQGDDNVDLRIAPITHPDEFSNLLSITVLPAKKTKGTQEDIDSKTRSMSEESAEYLHQMEQELIDTRESLRSIVEELESANEELKSANEESQSTNEELQSANEELESSKEEMQSLNEELQTSNQELQRKIKELTNLHNDLNNFLFSTQIGTVFLDKNLKIQRFTPPVKEIINLRDSDVGRSIEDFGLKSIDVDLLADIKQVINKLSPVEKEISTVKNLSYWMRILPYRTMLDRIDGVTITFTDISEQKKAKKISEDKDKKYKLLFEHMDNGFALFATATDAHGKITDFILTEANRAFENMVQQPREEIYNRSASQLFAEENYFDSFLKSGQAALAGESVQEEVYFEKLDKSFRIHFFSYESDFFSIILQDISRLVNELEATQHLASIVESSEDAIYSETPDGKILSWNQGASNLYGYTEQEAIGMSSKALEITNNTSDTDGDWLKVHDGRRVKLQDYQHKTKDERIIPVSITRSPITDLNGKVVAISNIIKDITVIKAREHELQRARQSTEKAAALKDAFLANISHEIRTPLNSIIGFTRLLRQTLTLGEQQNQVNAIYESGRQLLHLINDLVDISRIESGDLPLSSDLVDIPGLIKNLKSQFEGYSIRQQKPSIDFRTEIPETPPTLFIKTDEYRLQQVLSNLISNAFKCTEKGKIVFGYRLKKEKNIEFFVKDTGRGIHQSDQKIIFDRFKQIKKNSNDTNSGTGLGLTIAKAITQILGGTMWLQSQPDKGSTFYFTIPLRLAKADEISKKEHYATISTEIPDLTGKTILFAEDDPYSFEMLKYMLKSTGAAVLAANNGLDALSIFKENQHIINMVLLDIRLPGKSGYEILQEIKAANPTTIMIAQTAYALLEEVRKIKEKGFDDYLAKPLETEKLHYLLVKYLKG